MSSLRLYLCCLFSSCLLLSHAQAPDSWTRKADFPGAPRQDAACFSLGNKGYIVTGMDSSGTLLDEVWSYDAPTDSWTQLNDFPGAARNGASAFVVNDTAFVMCGNGGTDELKDCWKYDRGSDSWTRMQDLGTSLSGSFPARTNATGLSAGSYGFLFCGYDGSPGYLKQSLRFDPANDTNWSVARNLANVSDLTLFGRRWGAGFTIGVSPYYGTGFTFSQDLRKDIWRYDVPVATWVQVADFPDQRSNCFGFSLYGKGYIGGGTNGSVRQDVWLYDPASNAWIPRTDLPGGARVNAGCFTIGNRAYVTGGQQAGGAVYGDLWEYTPDSTVSVSGPDAYALTVRISADVLEVRTTGTQPLEGSVLEVFTLSGARIVSTVLHDGVASVPLTELPAATYLYRLSHDGVVVRSGKWVK